MVVTPTMNYASVTWTPSKEHEKMIQTTQRKAPSHCPNEEENTKRRRMSTTKVRMKEEETDRKNTKKREKVKERKKVQDGLKKKPKTGTTPTPIVTKTATSLS